MLDDGQAGGGEETLHHVLVHAGGGAEDAGADVGFAGELEEPLHGAVFAEGAVQHGEEDIDAEGFRLSLILAAFPGTRSEPVACAEGTRAC